MIKDLEESGFFFMGGLMQRAKELDTLKALLLCVYGFFDYFDSFWRLFFDYLL